MKKGLRQAARRHDLVLGQTIFPDEEWIKTRRFPRPLWASRQTIFPDEEGIKIRCGLAAPERTAKPYSLMKKVLRQGARQRKERQGCQTIFPDEEGIKTSPWTRRR